MIAAWENTDVFYESIPPVAIDFLAYIKIINFYYNANEVRCHSINLTIQIVNFYTSRLLLDEGTAFDYRKRLETF